MRRTLSAALVLLALAAPATAAAGSTTTGAVTTVPTLTSAAKVNGGELTKAIEARKAGRTSSGVSTGAAIAAVIAGLLALACLVWAVFRFGALEPQWLLSWRHSLAEASFRTSATWAELKDWARLGH